jgi:16S rRNA (cytidine1402-2'-O)-methyltransferase
VAEADDAAAPRGTLYVVATPIGNLGDVTLRALEVLRTVPLVAAEDTRVTRRLFERHAISTRLASYHARSTPGRTAELLSHLRSGADLALVTDAGTPGVSDPGDDLVAGWTAEGGRVVPIPGASAVLAAVAATGIAGPRWSFEGFLPRSGRERRERIARIGADERGTVLFERPDRLRATLRDLAAAAGDDRPAALARELTKRHEQIVRGSLEQLAERVEAGGIDLRGEAVVVVGARPGAKLVASAGRREAEAARNPPAARNPEAAPSDEPSPNLEQARRRVEALVASGLPRSTAAARVAAETGLPRRQLYRER